MLRPDVDRLIGLVKDSERFRVSVVYDRFALCRQVRFMYRDSRIPCFLDLFVFDCCTEASLEAFERQQQARDEMCAQLASREDLAFWAERPYLSCGMEGYELVAEAFSSRVEGLYETGFLTRDRARATGIIWGLDNLNDLNRYKWVCCLDDVLPTQALAFEGTSCQAPRRHGKFLSEVYGDIFALPRDLRGHFEHVSHEELASSVMREVMADFFGEGLLCEAGEGM